MVVSSERLQAMAGSLNHQVAAHMVQRYGMETVST